MASGSRIRQRHGFHFGKWKYGEDTYKIAKRKLYNGWYRQHQHCDIWVEVEILSLEPGGAVYRLSCKEQVFQTYKYLNCLTVSYCT